MTGAVRFRLRSEATAWREVDGQIVLISLSSPRGFRFSRSATPLWNQLAAGATKQELIAALVDRYELGPDFAAQEVDGFIQSCEARGLVERERETPLVQKERHQHESLYIAIERLRGLLGSQSLADDDAGLAELWDAAADASRLADTIVAEARIRATNGAARGQERHDRLGLAVKVAELDRLLPRLRSWWTGLEPDAVSRYLDDPGRDRNLRYLRRLTTARDHTLSADAEVAIAAKERAGVMAWRRLHQELLDATTVRLGAEEVGIDVARVWLESRGSARRGAAAKATASALDSCSRVAARVLEAVVSDKFFDDDLRGHPDWLSSVRYDAEVGPEFIPSLIEAVTSRADIARRYWHLKARALGLERITYDADRLAPLGRWCNALLPEQARQTVREAVADFSPVLGDVAMTLFDRGAVEVADTPEHAPSGFAIPVPNAEPRVFVTFAGGLSSLATLAHEVGHGIQAYLSRDEWGLDGTGLPKAIDDTAGLLAELVVMTHLARAQTQPERRLAVLGTLLDSTVSMVFRHIAMMRFEEALHATWRHQRALMKDGVGEMWLASLREMAGDSVELTDDAALEWVAVPHALSDPGGAWAHASSCLVAQLLVDRRQAGEPGFAEKVVALLSSGGQLGPAESLALVGLQLPGAPDGWAAALDGIDAMVDEVEELVG